MAAIPGFLKKAYEIFCNPEFSEMCGWNAAGDSVVIKKIELFSKVVLPKYFKHSNFQSFVRQLNMYDFHKTLHDPSHGEFKHVHFKRGHPELLSLIRRKAHVKGSNAGGGTGAAAGSAASRGRNGANSVEANELDYPMDDDELFDAASMDPLLLDHSAPASNGHNYSLSTALVPSIGIGSSGNGSFSIPAPVALRQEDIAQNLDAVMQELSHQQNMRSNFEKRLYVLETQSQRVQAENEFLRKMVIQSRQDQARMQDKVARVLFHLVNGFNNSGGQLSPALIKASNVLLKELDLLKSHTLDLIPQNNQLNNHANNNNNNNNGLHANNNTNGNGNQPHNFNNLTNQQGQPIVEFPEEGMLRVPPHGYERHSIEELGSSFSPKDANGAASGGVEGDAPLFRGISFLTDSIGEQSPHAVNGTGSPRNGAVAGETKVEVESQNQGYQVISPTPKTAAQRSHSNGSIDARGEGVSAESASLDAANDAYQTFLTSSLLSRNNSNNVPAGVAAVPSAPLGPLMRQPTLTSSGLNENSMLGRGNSLDYWGIRNIPIDQVDFNADSIADIAAINNNLTNSSAAIFPPPLSTSSSAKALRAQSQGTAAAVAGGLKKESGVKRAASAPKTQQQSTPVDAIPAPAEVSATNGNGLKRQKRDIETVKDDERVLPAEYMDLLHKKQEATLCRIDSLQMALDMLLDNGSHISESPASDKSSSAQAVV